MDNLFVRMPTLARLMALGMLVMFIAPFGMLIAKWAVIVALVDTGNLTLLIILAFGSAATFMVWAKWLGKMLAIAQGEPRVEKSVHRSEWAAIYLMAALSLALSLAFPFISEYLVVPWLADNVSQFFFLGSPAWFAIAPAVDFDNLLIMSVVVLVLIVVFAAFFKPKPSPRPALKPAPRQLPIYLAGLGLDFEARSYRNSFSKVSVASQRNWYLDGWFGEKAVTPIANIMCAAILLIGLAFAVLNIFGLMPSLGVFSL
jgi:ech hydrogenase subunit A